MKQRLFKIQIILTSLFFTLVNKALAVSTSSSLPWEGPIERISQSLRGPIASSIAVMCLVGCAVKFMTSEGQTGLKWGLGILIGFSIIVVATNLFSMLGMGSCLM